MNRVFVVQRPARYDSARRGWVSKFDLSPAKEHGELVFLLRPGNLFKDRLPRIAAELVAALADYGPGDHLLAVGDPVAIALATLAAGRASGGRVSLLKWDRAEGRYDAYVVDVSGNEGSAG
jgi:hypothetical protein